MRDSGVLAQSQKRKHLEVRLKRYYPSPIVVPTVLLMSVVSALPAPRDTDGVYEDELGQGSRPAEGSAGPAERTQEGAGGEGRNSHLLL